jgi:hypothetical protein
MLFLIIFIKADTSFLLQDRGGERRGGGGESENSDQTHPGILTQHKSCVPSLQVKFVSFSYLKGAQV